MNATQFQDCGKNQKILNSNKPLVGSYLPIVLANFLENAPFISKKLPNNRICSLNKTPHGFTLVELLITIVVAGVLISIAVPNFRTLVQNTRINGQVNDLIADISYARSEAIKSGSTATICTSTGGGSCDGGGNWTNGRLVWVDANANGALDSGEVRRFRQQLEGSNTLNVDIAADPLTFGGRGSQVGAGLAGTTITFRLCDARGAAYGRNVIINPLGQTRSSGPPITTCP